MDKPVMARGLFLLDNGYCPPSLKKENRESGEIQSIANQV
jgi:hypothetical protein